MKKELKLMLQTGLLFAFILSFNLWGAEEFSFVQGILNFLIAFIVVVVSLILRFYIQCFIAAKHGYDFSLHPASAGLVLSFFLTVFTNGFLKVFVAFSPELNVKTRVGRERAFPNIRDLANIAAFGILVNIILAFIAGFFQNIIAKLFYEFNFFYAIYNALPIPGLEGSLILFGSKVLYSAIFSTVLSYILLAFAGVRSLFLSLMIGILAGALFFIIFERKF